MQLIAVQHDIVWQDKPANHARVRQLLSTVAVQPGALIVLPEMFATGLSMDVAAIAEQPGGPTHLFLSELAREHRCCILGGLVTPHGDGRGRNELVAFDAGGQELTRYHKRHPFSFARETEHYAAGDDLVLFIWQDFTVALTICYDLRFPEQFRLLTRAGANLIVNVASWPAPREAHWLALLAARAIENQAFVVGVNRVGSDPQVAYSGRSQILDPRGTALAAADSGEQVLVADIELPPLIEYRRQFPALADIRSDELPLR